MTWRTYTVDGRSLVVDHVRDGKWRVRCDDGPEEQSHDLAAAILAASGMGGLEPLSPGAIDTWVAWARDHARQIAAEAQG